ncbi:MAG: sodium:solute symporter family protein [Holosporales bacterium]|jgi:SSS family solute:Na+ symporter|nr:sodium:solute symporter family protein [Holosporales bacterium]
MDIDLIIVGVSLIAALVLGVWSGRNTDTIKDFAIGDSRASAAALFATIVATYVGGVQGLAEKTFTVGVVFPLIHSLGSINLFFIGVFVAPRMKKYLGSAVSPGGLAYLFWGREGEIITGVAGVLYSLGRVAIQVCAIGFLFQGFLGVPYVWGTVIGCGVFIVYSAFGGVRAVLVTDAVQLLGVVLAIPFLSYLAIMNAGGIDFVLNSVPKERLSIAPLWEQPMKYAPILFSFAIWLMDPAWMQRLLMGKGVLQLKKAFCFSSIVCFPVALCSVCIGLSALATGPHIDPHVSVLHVIQTAAPAGLQGLIIAGLLAVIMSTVDSDLNVTSVMLICDILVPCKKRILTDSQMLRYAQYGTFALGAISIVVALYFRNIIDVLLYFNSFWAGTVLIPLSVSIFGYKSSKQAFMWSVGIGSLTILTWTVFGLEERFDVYSFFPSMIANAVVFFGLNEYGKRYGVLERESQRQAAKRENILKERERAHRLGRPYLEADDWMSLH